MSNNRISHSGVIDSIEDHCVHVRIVQTSACAGCKVSGYCHSAESKEKIVDVFCNTTSQFSIGENVTVIASSSVAPRALLWAFGVPFVIVMTVLCTVLLVTGSEWLSAVCSLASLIPYYYILWLLREKMRQQLAFSIEHN